MARQCRRRGRGCRSQAPSPAGRGMSESGEEDVGEGGGGALNGMISREFYPTTLYAIVALSSGLMADTKTEHRESVCFPLFNRASACSAWSASQAKNPRTTIGLHLQAQEAKVYAFICQINDPRSRTELSAAGSTNLDGQAFCPTTSFHLQP